MRSKDLIENQVIMESMSLAIQAMAEGKEEESQQHMQSVAAGLSELIQEEHKQYAQETNASVLAARGIRQLTPDEDTFYQSWINAHVSGDPRQEIANIDKAMPETVIDSVIDEMRESHALLENIDFMNCHGLIKMIINTGDMQLATWDKINTKIVKELEGSIDTVNLTVAKLSAFIIIPKDMLDLGPIWLDNYVRILLTESIAGGLEESILKGTGKDQPIGMCKDLDGAVTAGVYKNKTKVKLNTLEVKAYCDVIAPLAKKPYGGYRPVTEVTLVVNPVDYISKIVPSSTVQDQAGNYKNNVFPFPTKVVPSAALVEGEAILGLPKRYFMGLAAGGKEGKMEFSDEYQFLEDNRVYLIKVKGDGRPKDNNSFVYLDISSMVPMPLKVEVTNQASA